MRHELHQGAAIYWRPERLTRREVVEYWTFNACGSLLTTAISTLRSKERLAVVAHGMDFAAQVLDVHCELRHSGFHPTRVVIERGKWQQRWREGVDREHAGTRAMLWLDLQNFLPAPLREIARWLSLPYPNEAENDVSWLNTPEGTKWRCMVTWRALQAWQDFRSRFDLGYFSPTLAGQAFNAYRHRFMSHKIYVHVHDDVLSLEKEALYGGRVEVFFKGRAPKGDYVQVDKSSFYGSVMRGNLFPVKQAGHARRIGVQRLVDLVERFAVVARVELATELPRYPKRTDTSVIYPIGRFRTTLCTPEIRAALAEGAITKVEEVVTYEQAPIFDEFVDFFWDLRLRASRTDDRIIAEIGKRFLTAVFGKFGQKVWLSRLIREGLQVPDRIWREYDWQDSMDYEYRLVGGRMERSEREMMGRDTLLAIPAHVTSYGRVELWRLIETAGLEHVYYCDTDSLIVSRPGFVRLGREYARETLGGLRLTGNSSHLFIRAPKWYIFGDKTRRAGVPSDAYETAWNVFDGTERRSMRWSLSHDNPCSAVTETVRVIGPLTERIPTGQIGQRVEPLRYGEAPTTLPGGALAFPLPLSPVR
jgi:DNA polymerase type B, organellar and viral